MVLEVSELGIHADLGVQGLQGGVRASGKALGSGRRISLRPAVCIIQGP